jgi:hypothetical protein
MSIRELGTLLPAWSPIEWQDGSIMNRSAANKWGGKLPPPIVGQRVIVGVNEIGLSQVLGYFEEEGFLGVIVKPDNPPAWYVKQNGAGAPCGVFGPELKS